MFFCHRGGGIKQYLLAKHAWFGALLGPVRHTLLVPGPLSGFSDVQTCSGLSIPFGERHDARQARRLRRALPGQFRTKLADKIRRLASRSGLREGHRCSQPTYVAFRSP